MPHLSSYVITCRFYNLLGCFQISLLIDSPVFLPSISRMYDDIYYFWQMSPLEVFVLYELRCPFFPTYQLFYFHQLPYFFEGFFGILRSAAWCYALYQIVYIGRYVLNSGLQANHEDCPFKSVGSVNCLKIQLVSVYCCTMRQKLALHFTWKSKYSNIFFFGVQYFIVEKFTFFKNAKG